MSESKKSLAQRLAKVDAHVITPEEYEEASEWTADQIAEADVYEGDKLIRRGRPRKARPKEAVNLRLSGNILDHYRATGPGWQTRINADLERAVARARRAAKRA
jgi:uncharacterized protein (DUF4415 family)